MGVSASLAGCVSRQDIPLIGHPATETTVADRAGNLTGYDELRCDISQEETLATPVSATEVGDGDGEHWVYLLVDSQKLLQVDIDIRVNAEIIYEESVELGRDRYTSYEFKYRAPYSLLVTIDDGTELDVTEELINAPDGVDGRVSGQTYCITTGGDVQEQTWDG